MNELLVGLAAGGATLAALGSRYVARTRGPFEPTRYVWSRGLALLCDKNGGRDFVKRQRGGRPAMRFDAEHYRGVREGDLVWVRSIALPQFVAEVLPNVENRFALVTGDEDWSIPAGFPGADRLLADERLVCWLAQNYDGTDTSGKVSPIPIGLDFHTISNRYKWGHFPTPPLEQEAELERLVAEMPSVRERRLAVHADFHFNQHKKQKLGEPRGVVARALGGNPLVVFQQKKLRRIELWREKTRFAFVVSPHGNGLDCHRTWESLVLGNIVIVKRSSLDPLYEGLPVVIVDEWSEIERKNLERWRDQHADAWSRPETIERLTNRFWIAEMRRRVADALRGVERL